MQPQRKFELVSCLDHVLVCYSYFHFCTSVDESLFNGYPALREGRLNGFIDSCVLRISSIPFAESRVST